MPKSRIIAMGSMGAIGRRFSGHQAPVIRENRAQHSINSVLGIARASRALTLSLVPRDWVRCKTATPPMSQLGQTRRFRDVSSMSTFHLIAAMANRGR